MEFVPFRFAGAKFVSNVVDQKGEEGDINREGEPREHLFVGALETILIDRADDQQVNHQQQEQPLDRQLAHLAAVDHRAEYSVDARTTVGAQIVGAKPGRGNRCQLRPEPFAVLPGTERLAFGTEQQHGELAAAPLGCDNQRSSLQR